MTASWLIQMGWDEVFVLEGSFPDAFTETGAERLRVLGIDRRTASLSPQELSALLAQGDAAVIDFATSLDYRKGHIPGASFAIRSRLPAVKERLPRAKMLVTTSPDGALGQLAAADLERIAERPVKVLAGGTAAWRCAGLPFAEGEEAMLDEPIDVFHRPYDRSRGVEQAMRDYLSWEVDLVRQIERDGDARFRRFA